MNNCSHAITVTYLFIYLFTYLGVKWALDNGYTGSVSSSLGLNSISMYTTEIGVVGATRGGSVFVRYPGTLSFSFCLCHYHAYLHIFNV